MNIDLKFQDWALVLQRANVRQYDDRAHTLRVTGDLPAGWRWTMYLSVFSEAYFNAVALTESDGALTAVLTRGDLAFGDTAYTLQLVGTKDDVRRHTNPVRLYVGASLSGDGVWPEVPRSFTDAETAALAAAETAAQKAAEAAAAAAAASAAAQDLETVAQQLDRTDTDLTGHIRDAAAHVSAADRERWNAGGGGTIEVIAKTGSDLQPLFVDVLSGNWLGSQNAAYSTNAENAEKYFTFSGASGADTVSVTGGTASISSLTNNQWWRGIAEYDDGTCVPTMVSYQGTADALSIFPALTSAVTNGRIMPSMYSIHATSLGYKWYAQHVYNANAKHCLKSKPIALYRPFFGEANPLEKINSFWWGETTGNVQRTLQTCNNSLKFLYMNIEQTASEQTPKGFTWTVPVEGKTGYAEIAISGKDSLSIFEYPTGEGIFLELYQDGVLTETYHKKTVHLETVHLDFSGCDEVTIRVFVTGNTVSHSLSLSGISLWETGNYRTELLPFGSVPAQMFDSWGAQFDGATAAEFKRLHSLKLGVTAPWENHSQGGATSAWGRAWFYENVVQYHPTHVLIDFIINDSNSRGVPSFAQTVAGPDGTEYDNVMDTVDEYIANMIAIIRMSIAAGIQPIVCLAPYAENEKPDWSSRLIDAWADNAQNT